MTMLYPSFTPMSEILSTSLMIAVTLPDSVVAQVGAQDLLRTACAMGGLDETTRQPILEQWEGIVDDPDGHSYAYWGKVLALAITTPTNRACFN